MPKRLLSRQANTLRIGEIQWLSTQQRAAAGSRDKVGSPAVDDDGGKPGEKESQQRFVATSEMSFVTARDKSSRMTFQ